MWNPKPVRAPPKILLGHSRATFLSLWWYRSLVCSFLWLPVMCPTVPNPNLLIRWWVVDGFVWKTCKCLQPKTMLPCPWLLEKNWILTVCTELSIYVHHLVRNICTKSLCLITTGKGRENHHPLIHANCSSGTNTSRMGGGGQDNWHLPTLWLLFVNQTRRMEA